MTVPEAHETRLRPLFSVLTGMWISQAGYVVAELGVADHLSDQPRSIDEVAALVGADPDALYRTMRALTAVGVFTETNPRHFALNMDAQLLRSDSPSPFKSFITLNGVEHIKLFGELLHNVRTGESSAMKVYGKPFYDHLSENPELQETFSAAHGRTAPRMVVQTLKDTDLSGATTIADIGGGDGGLLEGILSTHPHLNGVLFDLPESIEPARTRLTRAGLIDRCELVGGSFFDTVPADADVYIIAHCLHNWGDDKAAEILGAIRAAIPEHGRLLVLEHMISGAGFHPSKLIDLLMMTIGGKERSETEYSDLLTKAGFAIRSVRPAAVPWPPSDSVIEAVAA